VSGTWRMFAHERNGSFEHLGERWWVEIHGLPDPIAEVELEDGKGRVVRLAVRKVEDR